jgi:flagellar biosynthesis protein FlhB
MVQTEGQLNFSKFTPNFANINPISGLPKLFKLERIFQIVRAGVLAAAVTVLSVRLVLGDLDSLVAATGRLETVAALAGHLLWQLLWLTVGVSVVLAAIDLLLTRRAWLVRNRMSKDEVKREYKESEGDPQIKQERRRAHQEMLNNTSLLALKDASVLIVNPTHLATALRYDERGDGAPQIIAKGQGALALQLMDAARAYGIPIVRDVPVARALHELELGDEVPEALYEAVAEILREVWDQSDTAKSAS